MRIVVVGGGGVARALVDEAHTAGHELVALENGDLFDPDALDRALAGCDAILAAFEHEGAGGTPDYSRGTASLLAAMQRTGTRRIVCLGAAGVESDPSISSVVAGLINPVLYGSRYADIRKMEELLARSHVDWTVVRPARITSGPRTSVYRDAERFLPANGKTISRGDVADFMLRAAEDGLYSRRPAGIAY